MTLWLIPLFPLLGFLVNGLFGNRLSKSIVNLAAIASVAVSFLYVVLAINRLYPLTTPYAEHDFTWIQSGFFQVGFDFLLDRLTAVMLLIVTGVGLLIHIYAIGYMAHEEGYARFFAYLNLFMFFMLVLVLASNLLLMFVGWEGVGLCSYLLVGFYFREKFASDAANKAFIVNRIGDFGFTLGMLLTVVAFKTLDFGQLAAAVASMPAEASVGTITAITLLLFVGATGKSAQLPLYVWLPDAMAGPTPVSALIHAATMVTAGVYMIARLHAVYLLSPAAMAIGAIVGALTAAFAAIIGFAQNDFKKVLAYSTVSQLGFMFAGVGTANYEAGIFHLVTHAFFKAGLFLCAGSVMHAMSGSGDIRIMGGLRKRVPITHAVFFVCWLAICGLPIFSGFFSKDAIIAGAFATENFAKVEHFEWVGKLVGVMLMVAALGTAFYMSRLYFLVFSGDEVRADEKTRHHIHESPAIMVVPLVVLAAGAVLVGFIGLPGGLVHHPEYNLLAHELEPVLGPELEVSHNIEAIFM